MKFRYTLNETKNNSEEKGFDPQSVRCDLHVSGKDIADYSLRIREFCEGLLKEISQMDKSE